MLEPKIEIRKATLTDLDQVIDCFMDSIDGLAKGDYSEGERIAWKSSSANAERWTKKMEEDYFLVAKTNNDVVGFGSLQSDGYIDVLYVHSHYAKIGLGARILAKLIEQGKELDHNQLLVDASITAKPLFEKFGFTVIRKNKIPRLDQILVNYRMKLRIA